MPSTLIFSNILRRHIALPQDHGSWVFIITPLIIGVFAGKQFSGTSLVLVIAAMSAFMLRQPVTIATKALSGRRPRSDLPATIFWIFFYSVILLISGLILMAAGETSILFLGIPAVPVFVFHLWLVGKRQERNQAGVEILGAGVLALAAPAAFWISSGAYHPLGWLLWALSWLQSAASIIYAYLRLGQRYWYNGVSLTERLKSGQWAVAFSAFNLALSVILSSFGVIPALIWVPYFIQAAESIWGTLHPAIGYKPTAIGFRQLFFSTLFTILFVFAWR